MTNILILEGCCVKAITGVINTLQQLVVRLCMMLVLTQKACNTVIFFGEVYLSICQKGVPFRVSKL